MKKIAMFLLHLNKKYSWLKYIVTIMLGVVLLLIYLLKERTIDEDQLQYRYGGIAYEVNTDKKFTGKAVGHQGYKSFVNGVKEKEVLYWNDGNLREEKIYKSNITCTKNYSDDGTLLSEESMDSKGERQGYFLSSADNKQHLIEAYYNHGKLNGKYNEWFENGQPRYELEYKDGLLNGIGKFWFRDGISDEVSYQPKTFYSMPLGRSKGGLSFVYSVKNFTHKEAFIQAIISLYNKDKTEVLEMLGNPDELDYIMKDMNTGTYPTHGNYLYYKFGTFPFDYDEYHIMLFLNSKNKIDQIEIVLARTPDNLEKLDALSIEITNLAQKSGVVPSAEQNNTTKLTYKVFPNVNYNRHLVSIIIKDPNIN